MALKFGARIGVTDEAMEDTFPLVLSDLGRQLLREARPDWETVMITVEPGGVIPNSWVVRLRCEGGTRDCIVRGG